jgi:hypothetical protein
MLRKQTRDIGDPLPVQLAYRTFFSHLSDYRVIRAGNLIDLLPSEPLWWYAGRIAGVAEKAVQASWRHSLE